MPVNSLHIETKVIILTDESSVPGSAAITTKSLIVTVRDGALKPVEGAKVVFKPNDFIALLDINDTSNADGECSATVSLNYDLAQPWASSSSIDIRLETETEEQFQKVKVYYGTLPAIDFLNIKKDLEGGYYYDRYGKEDDTIIIIHTIPSVTKSLTLTLTLYFDTVSYQKLITPESFPIAINLRDQFDKSAFSDGQYDLYYTLSGEAGNIATSLDFNFRLDHGTSERTLPAIDVPGLYNGYINQALWLKGVAYNFKPIIDQLVDESGLLPDNILDYIDKADSPVVLRFQGTKKDGQSAELNITSTEPFTWADFKDIISSENPAGQYIFLDERDPLQPKDRYTYIEQGALEIDATIKTITSARPHVSKLKRVLVDILPPAKLED
ncbi:hypothetical protein M2263_004571 [Providencia alcalifaciens]|nr:hypothetical protein [Providencia alcalifaciens]